MPMAGGVGKWNLEGGCLQCGVLVWLVIGAVVVLVVWVFCDALVCPSRRTMIRRRSEVRRYKSCHSELMR